MRRTGVNLLQWRPQRQLSKFVALAAGLAIWSSTDSRSAAAADTQSWSRQEIADEVAGHPGTTYFELLKQAIPGLDDKGNGHLAKPLRHIAEGYGGDLPTSLNIESLRVVTFTAEGRKSIAILTGIGTVEPMVEQPAMLAVFDDTPTPGLLDVVDVGMDRDTSYGNPVLVNISPDSQALVTRSSHFNSSENFETTALIMLHGGRLKLIDTFSTYGERVCGASIQQVLALEGHPGGNDGLEILARIEEITEPTDEICEGTSVSASRVTSAETHYRWDAKTMNFRASSDALEKLQLRTAERLAQP